MSEFLVEYMVAVSKSESLWYSIEDFNRLLQENSAITISERNLHFETQFVCDYTIFSGEIPDKDQRYFHLKFIKNFRGEPSDNDLADFDSLLETVRNIITTTQGKIDPPKIEPLWDDISYHYSHLAYPKIYEAENLMRKLIANSLLVNVGRDWVKIEEEVPPEFQKIATAKAGRYQNSPHNMPQSPLQIVDFKDLSAFLFKRISPGVKDIHDSNWDNYFSKLIDVEDLESKWQTLHDLRCQVAHNRLVTRSNFDQIVTLTTELIKSLKRAISKLPQVSLTREERRAMAESMANTFCQAYKKKMGEYPTEHTQHFLQLGTTPLEWLDTLGWRNFLKSLHTPYYIANLPAEHAEEIVRAFCAAKPTQYQQRQLTLSVPTEFRVLLSECVCEYALKLLNDLIPRGVPFKTIKIVDP